MLTLDEWKAWVKKQDKREILTLEDEMNPRKRGTKTEVRLVGGSIVWQIRQNRVSTCNQHDRKGYSPCVWHGVYMGSAGY